MKVVENRLGKYVPDLVEKIIKISEKYENDNCTRFSDNTMMLKRLQPRIMKKNASTEVVYENARKLILISKDLLKDLKQIC